MLNIKFGFTLEYVQNYAIKSFQIKIWSYKTCSNQCQKFDVVDYDLNNIPYIDHHKRSGNGKFSQLVYLLRLYQKHKR